MSGDTRGYSLDVSEYLFRLTTESLRLHSNETQRYQTLANLVHARIAAGAIDSIVQHDLETLRQHLGAIPTKGPIRIYLSISKTGADSLMQAKRRYAKQLGASLTVGDALSMLLFDYVVERNSAQLLSKLGVEEAVAGERAESERRSVGESLLQLP